MDVTAVLLNYQRPLDMARLIGALRGQDLKPKILLVDNAKEPHPLRDEVDRYMHIPWNAGCFARLHMAHFADTEYVLFVDDDRVPRDERFLRDALAIAREHPGVVTGAQGRLLSTIAPHYRLDIYGEAHVVKGFCVLFERKLLERVPITPPFAGDQALFNRCDDIHLSVMTAAARPTNWADERIHQTLFDDSKPDMGLCTEPRHYKLRDEAAKRYLHHFGMLAS